jgi:DNA-binding transcriptional ArsR family regulator
MASEQLNQVLEAVSDPTRRAIIDRLSRGTACVTDVAEPFAMSLNAVSKHIKVLERAGLVRRHRVGKEHRLALDAAPLHEVARWTHRYARYWNDRLDSLEEHFSKNRRWK